MLRDTQAGSKIWPQDREGARTEAVDLCNPGSLGPFLKRHGLTPAKALGQHFLCSPKIVATIADAVADCKGILEVGPGPGVLTAKLSEFAQLVAVEIDARAVGALAESAPAARVVHADALKTDLETLIHGLPNPRAIVSNMPYGITGPLLERFTRVRALVERAVLMMQREVADRILAQPGDSRRGALSVSIQLLFDVRRLANVPSGSFWPPPKVASTVLVLNPRDRPAGLDVDRLLDVARTGFLQPRKTLLNNLQTRWPEGARRALDSAGLAPAVRAHQLSLDEWIELKRALA